MTRIGLWCVPTVLLTIAFVGGAIGGEPVTPAASSPKPATDATPTSPAAIVPTLNAPKVPPRAELEAEFRNSLTDAVLAGTWQMTGKGGLTGDDPLSEAKPEKYTISGTNKLNDDTWVIVARIEFGDKDVTVPVPVRVVWAEDTAMITVTDLAVPMIGTYSARVIFHKGFYTGIWYSAVKNYGGVMSGRILKAPPAGNAGANGAGATPAAPAEKRN